MTMRDDEEREWNAQSEQNPFAEAMQEATPSAGQGLAAWSETLNPFSEALGEAATESASETDRLLGEAFAELRDEAFDEAVAYLGEETEQAIADRFTNESPSSAAERERYGDAQLSAVRFESQQYLDALEAGIAGLDLDSLADEQLDEVLDRFDPQTGELTPAGEEFIGALARKAKSVVKFVAKTAKSVGKIAGSLLGPVLQRLRGLVNPLLRRVLSFAIGRLPTALQPAARTLAARITSEAEAEEEQRDEGATSPANLTDVEALAESFDAALAEAITQGVAGNTEVETEASEGESPVEGRELEVLAEARGQLIDRLQAANDGEDLGPAVEQFVPALLGALRLGINLVGRPKVVGFLARYLGQLIRGWVGSKLSGPLSNAIVDTGLRLVSLESESGEAGESRTDEAGPAALASAIEDTVRQLAEAEDYTLENEDLLQLAAAEAFGQAVGTYFPQKFVKPSLQQAPSIGGTFIARRPRSVRTYHKYNRIPEVEITAQIADALPTFGGTTLGAAMRAAGATFPIRARLHIYQSAVGTSLPRMVRVDRAAGVGRGFARSANVHPLTPAAAGLLLREPRLGVAVRPAFMRSRHRIAAGQRFYFLEPVGAVGALALQQTKATRAVVARLAPSRAWIVANLRKSSITVGFYLSEVESQGIAEAIRQGRGAPVLLTALANAYRSLDRSPGAQGRVRIVREDGEDFEDLVASAGRRMATGFIAPFRRRIRAWVLPALAAWARTNGEEFARAAAHPDAGVTIRVRLTSVPGLELLAQGWKAGGATAVANAFRGTPVIAITVTSGRRRK